MKLRFQADADFNQHIVLAILRQEGAVDFRTATEASLAGLSDLEVLAVAAKANRVLITHDGKTMPHHFARFIRDSNSPGVLIVPQHLPIAVAAEELLLLWLTTKAEDWQNQICWLPL